MHNHVRIAAVASLTALVVALPVSAQSCTGNLNSDNRVDGADLGTLLAVWGACAGCAEDLTADGQVDGADLGALLNNWGVCPGIFVPPWGMLIEEVPDPAVVTDPALRAAIAATGLAWRVRDTATQMEMLLVPPGTFQMGCTVGSNQWRCYVEELPVHQVTLTNAFYLGRYEVTQSQWVATMGSNPSYFVAGNGYPGSDARPVEQVSWNTIQGFLSATGLRLPTEAEWEYACRAGTQTPFYNGSTDVRTVGTLAWYSQSSGGQSHPVGDKLANAFGFHDMLGNLWEWVSDRYGGYTAQAQADPTGPENAFYRTLRGGAWTENTQAVTSSWRCPIHPDGWSYTIGFRVARTP